MKTIYKKYSINKTGVSFSVSLVALFRAVGEEGALTAGAVPAEVLDCLRVGVESPNVSGVVMFKEGHGYVIDGDVLTVTVKGLTAGVNLVHVRNQYGTNLPEMLVVELVVPDNAPEGIFEIEDDITLSSANTFIPAAGGGMEQYVLTIKDGKFHHDDEELNFEAVKGAVMDRSKFVYLHFANAFHLPCFIVDAAGRQSVEFTSSFVIGGQAHIERVIINEQEEINVDNVQTLRINEDGGVAFGEGCEAMSEGSFAHGQSTIASGEYSHAEGVDTTARGYYSHAEGWDTQTSFDDQHAQGTFNNADDFEEEDGAFMHGCGTSDNDRKNAFAISADGSIYVIGLGGYDGTNHAQAQSLQEIFGTNNIQASSNTLVNGYQVPNPTAEQVTQAYNAVVAGRPVTITDATGNYHLSVMQADNLSGDLAISIIYLNVMLLTYEISGGAVDIQFKNL